MTVSMETIPCPLGCVAHDAVVLRGKDILNGVPGQFTVVKCQQCGLMRTNPRPTAMSIGEFYPDEYGPYVGTRVDEASRVSHVGIKTCLRRLTSYFFNSNAQRLPKIPPGRMLEIGCASGSFLHEMARQGWDVEGIEFSEKAAARSSQLGYRVHAGALESAPDPGDPFDLIVGWMVLEHLHDPLGGLKKLKAWAKPDAWLVFSIPNAASLEFSIFKENWYALQLPTHLHHFTPETIEMILEASGWTLDKIHHQRVLSNLIVSTGYLLQAKGFINSGQAFIDFPKRARYWVYVLFPISWLLSLFGQTGRMTVWAKRKPL